MKNNLKYSIFFIAVLSLTVLVPGSKVFAAPAFNAAETVANVNTATIPSITLAGGVNAAAASTTITIPAALAASATDHSITIDDVTIDLGSSALTPTGIATAIKNTSFAAGTVYGTKPYTVTSNGADVIFTRNATGSGSNGVLAVGDANYTTTNEVKATKTLTVATTVASSTAGTAPVQLTIGTCVVSFATTTSGHAFIGGADLTADEVDCTDHAATILLATSSVGTDVALTVNQTAQELRGLKNVSDTGHTALTVGGNTATVTFTTTGAETSATPITASLSTGSAITLTTVNTTGVIKVTSAVPSITLANGATAAQSAVTITIPVGLPASANDQSIKIDNVTIDLGSSALTPTEIATVIKNKSFATGAVYGTKPYTVTSSGANVTFTRNAAGADGDGTLTVSDAIYSGIAQQATFTLSGTIDDNYDVTITINGTSYSHLLRINDTFKELASSLASALAVDPYVSCTASDAVITCVSDTPGTSFTYSTSLASRSTSSSTSSTEGSRSGGGGGGSFTPVVKVTAITSSGLTADQIQSIRNQINSLLQLLQRLQQKLLKMQGY